MKLVLSLICFFNWFSLIETPIKEQNKDHSGVLDKIIKLNHEVKELHPALENFYPVAIYEADKFYIYDFDSTHNKYKLIKTETAARPVAKGTRAAYPLQENDFKMTCVVTGEVFESLGGYATIFHEFVHCYQAATVEFKLKDNLDIYKKAMEQQDWMWELNYPFPYEDNFFVETYSKFLSELEGGDFEKAIYYHNILKDSLKSNEYQYLTWVEWKEGSARWIENLVREKLNIEENSGGNTENFDRVSFYYSGSEFIKLINKEKGIKDLEDIYSFIINK